MENGCQCSYVLVMWLRGGVQGDRASAFGMLVCARIDLAGDSPTAPRESMAAGRRRAAGLALLYGLAFVLLGEVARANVAEEQKQMFDEEGIQRGSFLNGQWVSYPTHGAPDRCATSTEEKDALKAIYNKMGGDGWTTKWDLGKCPCLHQWHGVVCDAQGHIVSLDLSQNGLTGTMRVNSLAQVAEFAHTPMRHRMHSHVFWRAAQP